MKMLINKRLLNQDIDGTAYFNVFDNDTINRFMQPTLYEDNLNAILIHIGCNDIVNFDRKKAEVDDIVNKIIYIEMYYRRLGVEEVMFHLSW